MTLEEVKVDEAEVDFRTGQTAIATETTAAAALQCRPGRPEAAACSTGSRMAVPLPRETTIATSHVADRTVLQAVTATSRSVQAVVMTAGQETLAAEAEAEAEAGAVERATRSATAVGSIAAANTEVAICRPGARALRLGKPPSHPKNRAGRLPHS